MTLGFSRHLYAELVFDQRIGTWIARHRRAFEFFGAVPRRIVPGNLKAAVLVASLHDPVPGEAYRRMAQHDGFLISPTRPRTPQHKGKIEAAIHYLERAFIAGREFADIDVANARLRRWLVEVAGVRRHGTTGQAPLTLFRAREQAAMLPLPAAPFDLVEVRRAKVHRDCHVVLDGSFYWVPWPHVGSPVEAYVGERVVELSRDLELLTTHPRAHAPGEWHTRSEHYPPEKAAYLERTPARCRGLARQVGPATFAVVDTLLAERPLDRRRSVQAILRLEEGVGAQGLEAACRRARHFGDVRYRKIKEVLSAALDRDPPPIDPRPPAVAEPERVYTFARSVAEFFGMAEALR
jgi:hypothetical protein